MTAATLVLTVGALALAGVGWRTRAGTRAQLAVVVAMVSVLTAVALLVLVAGRPGAGDAGVWEAGTSRALLVLFGVLAVAGGGPVAVAVLRLADHKAGRQQALDDGEVLRGGAWIGSLERAGIFATLAAGWPEGVAVVLAIKGVGRYQELGGVVGAAERFIIGTFASALWATACAGVWWSG